MFACMPTPDRLAESTEREWSAHTCATQNTRARSERERSRATITYDNTTRYGYQRNVFVDTIYDSIEASEIDNAYV